MKKIISILSAALVGLFAVSCIQEELAVFDASKATAPVLQSYTVTDDDVTIDFTPATFGQNFNTNMPVNHSILLKSVNGNETEMVIPSTVKGNKIVITVANLSKALIGLGYQEGQIVALEMSIRASMQEVARDNRRNGFTESAGTINIPNYEVYLPTGDPYGRYTEKSAWGLVGSFNGWGSEPDVEMWTNGTLHVAKGVKLSAGDEVKFRKDSDWAVNFGYADGVTSYTLGEEFALGQDGKNIVIAESGAYDFILDPEKGTAKIIKTQAVTVDPYAAYKEVSPWSVIGSFNSWGGDVEMVTNGTLHVAKAIAFNADTEWKFRKDADWAVNFGYAEGVTSYTLGEEFALGQDGKNIKITEDGVYDLILDPENATAKIIASIAVDQPEPPAPEEKPAMWSLVGTIDGSNWDKDFDMSNTSGDVWMYRSLPITADSEFKIRADHEWAKSVGGPEDNNEGTYKPEIGKKFDAGDKNIKIGKEGLYDVTFDYAAKTILIEEHVAAYSLIGMINGTEWNTDFLMTEKNGVWTSEVVKIAGGFKIRYDYSWADENTYGADAGFEPQLGVPFTATQPGSDIKLAAGDYKVQFTPATKEVIITAVAFPEHLYMIGDEFGGWDWGSDGVVEMVPVVYQPDWGDGCNKSEAQFWTVRYFSANKGFKFNSKKQWGGDFWGLDTNEGFAESGGNCVVDKDGFYLVHVDLKRSIVHVEPARVYGMGNCFGGWNSAMEGALFQADGKTLKATAQADGELRMYVESAISNSDWWTREFVILDGKIDYRGDDEGQGDQARVNVQKGQVVTLDFNAGTGSVTGEAAPSELPEHMYMIGAAIGGWDWDANGQEMIPVNGKKGHFWAIRHLPAGQGFKFCSQKAWSGDFASLGEADSGFTVEGGNCNVAADNVYMIYVDVENKKICVEPAKVYGKGDCFGGWDADPVAFAIEGDKVVGTTTGAGEIRLYADSSIAVSDWWTREFVFFEGKIAYRGNGGDQERVNVDSGKKVTLDFNAGTATVE